MGKTMSLYLDDDLIEFIDNLLPKMEKAFGGSWNRSKLVSFIIRQSIEISENIISSPHLNIARVLEQAKRQSDEELLKKKPKVRY